MFIMNSILKYSSVSLIMHLGEPGNSGTYSRLYIFAKCKENTKTLKYASPESPYAILT